MSYSYEFLLIAIEEYEESIVWYRKRSQHAAVKFVEAVEHGIEIICANPESFNSLYSGYHEYPVRKYPFTIVYRIDKELLMIRIVAVYHQNRHPETKYR